MTENELDLEQARLARMAQQLNRVGAMYTALEVAEECPARKAEIKLSGDGRTATRGIEQKYFIFGLKLALRDEKQTLKDMGYTGPEVEGITNDSAPRPDNMAVNIVDAKYPLRWDGEYYAVWLVEVRGDIKCPACDGKGTVVLCDGKEYICPNCDETEVEHGAIIKREYQVLAYKLAQVSIYDNGKRTFVCFRCNGRRDLFVRERDLADMKIAWNGYHEERNYPRHIYNNREEAQKVADKLNEEAIGE
jgi:hypothetical protein